MNELTLDQAMTNAIRCMKVNHPNMSNEDIVAGAFDLVRKTNPEFFAEEKEPEEIPNYIFHEFDSMEATAEIKDYLLKNNPDMTPAEAHKKAEETYFKVVERTIQCNPNLKRDMTAEALFRKAVLDPYEAAQAAKLKTPEPAVIATEDETKPSEEVNVESKPEEMEVNFDPTNPALGYFQQYPVNPMFTQPIHKVDEPPKAPKPVIPEDNVQSNLNQVNFGGLMKPAPIQQVPEVIGHKLTNPEMVVPVTENICNNDIIIGKFPKIPLKGIEQIANANGVSVLFEEYPWTNLISVTALDAFGQAVAPKCFVIDTGMIIDPRAKLIATNPKINPNVPLEFAQMFELFVIDTKNHNRKLLDEKLINDIFIGGLLNISKKEMYSAEYKKLNSKVALITMPTKGITKEMRNALQEYLMKMDEHGDFDKAISMSPNGCRFVFNTDRLDRDHLSDFSMINEGVPLFYGTPAPVVNPTIIESKDGKVSIRAGRT